MWMALPHAYAGRRARWPCERMRQPGPRRPRRRLKLGNSCWFRGLLGHSEAPRRRGCRHVASPRHGGHSRTRQDIVRTPPCAMASTRTGGVSPGLAHRRQRRGAGAWPGTGNPCRPPQAIVPVQSHRGARHDSPLALGQFTGQLPAAPSTRVQQTPALAPS